jgi:hypothetical protein
MKNNGSYSDFLKQENELTKLKIQAEFGFEISGENNLNPAIENIWLKQILDFERSMAKNEKTTIREKIGNPVLIPANEVSTSDLPNELQTIMEMLNKHNIVIDSVAGAPDEEMYKFIVEEFLDKEINVHSPANMLTCYIYEEYHPNHDYDIRNRGKEFINALEEKECDFSFILHEESKDEIHQLRFENLKRKLKLFKDAFDEIEVKTYEIVSLTFDETKAEMDFTFKLSVLPAESRSHHKIEGKGKFILCNLYEWWSIVDVEMKGVV